MSYNGQVHACALFQGWLCSGKFIGFLLFHATGPINLFASLRPDSHSGVFCMAVLVHFWMLKLCTSIAFCYDLRCINAQNVFSILAINLTNCDFVQFLHFHEKCSLFCDACAGTSFMTLKTLSLKAGSSENSSNFGLHPSLSVAATCLVNLLWFIPWTNVSR